MPGGSPVLLPGRHMIAEDGKRAAGHCRVPVDGLGLGRRVGSGTTPVALAVEFARIVTDYLESL